MAVRLSHRLLSWNSPEHKHESEQRPGQRRVNAPPSSYLMAAEARSCVCDRGPVICIGDITAAVLVWVILPCVLLYLQTLRL